MAIQVYNFNKFDGYAINSEHPEHEYRIYLKGNTNTLATITNQMPDRRIYYLHLFIADKEHLKNLSKDKINLFEDFTEIWLYVDKINSEVKALIEYAINCDVNVRLLKKDQWGEPIE